MRGARTWVLNRLAVVALSLGLTGGVGPILAAVLEAQAVPREQETGMVRWGSTVVWFRATDAGRVLVYASKGFRSAFARPVAVSADDADRWAVLVQRLASPVETAGQIPARAAPDRWADTSSRVELADGEIVVETPAATSSPKLEIQIGATRPDVVTAVLFPDVAEQAGIALQDAARTARAFQAAAAVAPPADPNPAPSATALPSAAAPAPPSAPAPAVAAAPPAAATVAAPPPLTAPSLAAAPRVEMPVGMRLAPSPSMVAAPRMIRTATVGNALPVMLTQTSAPLHVATSALATAKSTTHTSTISAPPAVGSTAAVRHSATTRTGSRVATTAIGLDDIVVSNLVHQWQPDLMYCYTQYGLREHPALNGQLTVRVALSADGSVGHSVIGTRHWSGTGGGDVESCIRARVAAWRFPPAATGSLHAFTLQFGAPKA